VLRLRVNHSAPVVNVRAHARVVGLWERREGESDWKKSDGRGVWPMG
jgi:hypothetical protein